MLQTLTTTEFSWSENTFILYKNLRCQLGLKTSTSTVNHLQQKQCCTWTLNVLQQQQSCYINFKCFVRTAMLVNKDPKIR